MLGDVPTEAGAHVLAHLCALVVDGPAVAEVEGVETFEAVEYAGDAHRDAGGVDVQVFEGDAERAEFKIA